MSPPRPHRVSRSCRLAGPVVALLAALSLRAAPAGATDGPLPFDHRVEVYRSKEGDIVSFAVRLEQPFLAEEFEKSNYLRLEPIDDRAYLVYPRETKFHQKHAAFYGRLRGAGDAKLKVSYETVTENIDGTRRIDVQQGEIVVPIPEGPCGSETIHRDWARQQNAHFLNLLTYYPEDSFLQFALLQSKDRYGVTPPALPSPSAESPETEANLYSLFSGALAMQDALQSQTLRGKSTTAAPDTHINTLYPPDMQSPAYAELLKKRREEGAPEPKLHELARVMPADQYFLQVNTLPVALEMLDLSHEWGGSLLRLFTIRARDHHEAEKFEQQLCLPRAAVEELSKRGVIGEAAFTGSDPAFAEGTDLTIILRVRRPAEFDAAAAEWFAHAQQTHADVEQREFNYRGHKVAVRYTPDRAVSSFVVRAEDLAIFSNSHVAIRRIVDTIAGSLPSLYDAADYRYVASLLSPSDETDGGYVYVSDACIRRLVGPRYKISERRRRQ